MSETKEDAPAAQPEPCDHQKAAREAASHFRRLRESGEWAGCEWDMLEDTILEFDDIADTPCAPQPQPCDHQKAAREFVCWLQEHLALRSPKQLLAAAEEFGLHVRDTPCAGLVDAERERLAKLEAAISEALDGFAGPDDLLECEPKHWWRALSTILAAIDPATEPGFETVKPESFAPDGSKLIGGAGPLVRKKPAPTDEQIAGVVESVKPAPRMVPLDEVERAIWDASGVDPDTPEHELTSRGVQERYTAEETIRALRARFGQQEGDDEDRG